jgi:hypothetical protein
MHCPNSSPSGLRYQLFTVEGHHHTDWRHRQHCADYLRMFEFLTDLDTCLSVELSRPELVKA